MKTIYKLFLVLFSAMLLKPALASGWVDSTLFSPKLFIENKGQFDYTPFLPSMPKILFAVNHTNTKMFFSEKKIAYTLLTRTINKKAFEKFQQEEAKEGSENESMEEKSEEQELKNKIIKIKTATVFMEWLGANPDCKIEASQVAEEYFNYAIDGDIHHDINFAHGYKKITYKNIYNGIDIEYTFHEKTGIKYNIILHPEADIAKIKLKYSGAQSISLDNANNVVIKTSLGNIIDNTPVSFQNNNGLKIKTKFVLKNNILSFSVDDYDNSQTLVIDPWIISPITQPDTAYEIAVDPTGNVFVYGDLSSQVKKYNNAGVAQWTYTAGPGWQTAWNQTRFGGDVAVDPMGNSFISNEGDIIKFNPAGISQWHLGVPINITTLGCEELAWRLIYDAANNLLYGAGSNGQCKASSYDPATGNCVSCCKIITPPCSTACIPNEIRHMTLAPNGNFYGYTALGPGSPPNANAPSTITGFDPNLVGIYHTCNVSGSPYSNVGTYFSYGNLIYYMGNGIAASNCYIYIYSGDQVQKYDIYNPSFLGSTNIAGGLNLLNSGILADLSNNFYVGTQTGISAYSPTFSLITSVATPNPVYDMAFAPGNTIAACGIGFVGVFANVEQTGSPITCTPQPPLPLSAHADSIISTGCASNTSMAWVDSILNGSSPYTFSWSNGATTDTIANLAPGNYTCIIIDSSCPQKTTTVSVTIPPSVGGLHATTTPSAALCFGDATGSATATITGGILPYTYIWNPSSQTTANATGLSAGIYTVTVTDANGCSGTQTVTITQPTALTSTTSATSATCIGNNGTASVAASGGSGSYTYLWNPSAAITAAVTGLPSGIYSVTITDAHGCTTSNTTLVTPIGSITATATNSTICAGQNATLTASGGTNYSWSTGATTSSITTVTTATTTYSVIVSSGLCADTAYASVEVNPSPVVSLGNNQTLCAGQEITLDAGNTGAGYLWSTGETTQTINIFGAGTYWVIVALNNCLAKDTVKTFIAPQIHLFDSSLCTVSPIVLDPGGGATSYLWSNGSTTQTISVDVAGSYSVVVFFGTCKTSDSSKITGDGTGGVLYIPTAFTPNNDNINEVFTAKGTGVDSFHMNIFDRWGNLIFSSDNINNGWDGRVQGGHYPLKGDGNKIVQEDVYIWKIDYTTQCEPHRIKTKIGTVTILK